MWEFIFLWKKKRKKLHIFFIKGPKVGCHLVRSKTFDVVTSCVMNADARLWSPPSFQVQIQLSRHVVTFWGRLVTLADAVFLWKTDAGGHLEILAGPSRQSPYGQATRDLMCDAHSESSFGLSF